MPFSFHPMDIPDVFRVVPRVFKDERGFFAERFKASDFATQGITAPFVQMNHSRSGKGVLRGLHYQLPPHAQGKLVTVLRGRIFDVAVDIRKESPTFGKWVGAELTEENREALWIPPGFAHGFVSLEEGTEILYLCTAEYDSASDRGVRWDDPEIGIRWPVSDPQLSQKDREHPLLKFAALT